MTFFYVENEIYSDRYKYYKSEDLKMFHYLHEVPPSSDVSPITTTSEQRKIRLDKDS